MAAEVPAKDVLCEAMEYLSKLGSNLRTRSENLKDKKIRREKLNNVLAVQKAANKVLLICELSKKSLENVETGVRKVLKYIDTSQTSSRDGAKTSKIDNDGSELHKKYYYIVYKSRKLKMKNRISLKHYTSVRVRARSLPKSMIDKYPVHYDCKLYRMRKREERLHELKKDSQHDTDKVIQEESSSVNYSEVKEKSKQGQESNMSVINIPDTPSPKSKANNKHECSENQDMSVISIPDTPRSKSIDKKNDEADLSSENEDEKKSKYCSKTASSPSNKEKERKRLKSADDKCHQEYRKNCCDTQSDSNTKSNKNYDKKKVKRRIIADSSDDDNILNSLKEPEPKRRKLSETSANQLSEDSNDHASKSVENAEKNIDNEQNSDPANDSKKPMIKCVSLSKLLKPNVHKKEDSIIPKAKGSFRSKEINKFKEKHTEILALKHQEEAKKVEILGQKQKEQETKNADKLAQNRREEEEYWSQKRKDVSEFEPKNFVINVTRLPKLTADYMNKLGLRKITKGGVTLCEINVNEDNVNVNNKKPKSISNTLRQSSSNEEVNDDDLIAEANKVKRSLLNESDSDGDAFAVDNKENKSSKENNDKIKSALLNSDSDNNSSENGSKSGTQKPNYKSDASNKSDAKIRAAQGEAKNKLLDSGSESESENSKKATKAIHRKKIKGPSSDPEDNSVKDTAQHTVAKDSDLVNKISAEAKQLNEVQNQSNSDSDSKSEKHKKKTDGSLGGQDSDEDNISKQQEENDEVRRQNENLSQLQINEKTPEKKSPNDSDDKEKTPLSQRITPQSKKKRLRESVHAKKMLLTYSSSDTEDEQLKDALKEIKHALLNGSDEENSPKKQEEKNQSRNSSPSSSEEDILLKAKKKNIHLRYSSNVVKVKSNRKKQRRKLDSDNSDSNNSNSSSSKMVRSKSKPGNSSSQNSDATDSNDKDIDGLTNLNTLTKTRRRHSNSSDMTEEASANTRSRRLKIKPTGLICEEMLKAESSSDAVSASGEENDNEDLPPVTLPSFNGDGEHLVKEDLLGESDSSVSHNDSANKDDSEDEEKVNSRRRKQLAISSDSEVGSSRKKDADVRLSDFEDSDDSELTKRSKRKKKANDSDASVASNSSNEGGKKKRRRIKSVRDSDASGSESENEGRNKHGRKNIRKVMGKNQLEEATKKAAREEKERMARIAERQKMYNNMQFDESGKPDEVVLDKVILDFDPETKEPLIEVDRGLVKKLKPHQANGIKFMWDACFESAKRIKKDKGSGCILAHCMGLGKTLQVVSLTHTLLTHSDLTKVNRVLVVCPLSTVLNWVNEFRMWLKHAETEYDVDVYELSRYKQNSERSFQLSQWFQYGGVCVLGYEMFRNLSADNVKKFKKKMLKNFQEALVDPGPDLVVCDEGHLLKNEKTSLSQSMNRVKTLRRIVLTGTPLQNNLKEYYCMVQFVKPNLLGKYNEYLNRFVNPITNGQYTDSTEHDIKIMKRRSHVLHKMLDGAVQRRDYGVLAPFLPPKHEYVLFITLSEVQVKLYQHYLDNFSRRPQPGKSSGFLFPDFQSLQRIWTHPLVLKYNSERYEIMQQKKRDKEEEDSEGSLVDFIDDDSTPDETSTDESSDDSSDMSDDSRKKSKKKKSAKKGKGKDKEPKGDGQSRPRRGTRANPLEMDAEEKDDDILEVKNENPTEWWIKLVAEAEIDDMRNSHKLVLLFDILRQCETIGDKLLVFSQSLYSLDLIEHFLGKVDEATQEARIDEKLGGHVGSWSPGVDYFRLDGSTSCENRSIWCKNFNREDNPRARLFLISTRAGGLGINLVAANRVVIFDVSWNPSHDVQSIFRVYRFGQKKPCYVYRFLAMGTMEEKIYERQVTKQAISKRVIDEQQIDRHYAENDLAELYKFEPQPPVPRPIPPLPKDRLFAEMLREHEAQIYKYHEHDSLLENKEEETLSEEERKAAWEDFENEKNKPPPAPFPSPWPMHNGMVPGLLAQQQQQLAYAALAAMLRKDMPNLNDNQLRDMLPLIYNANPQLMQKMSEIYKYPQAGMMNPAMMNPGVMNAAAGAGGMSGMSGASGLQYEPPWQRQQQQQQQMRLQQLMQQQNQMGAKYYAGGLGSRDPVAMALQQQQARQIMLGNNTAAAARPRGRPPLQPRAPPSNDVVNLDSD